MSLWALLAYTRTFEASDPRDKLIALLGIAADVEETIQHFLVDYMLVPIQLWLRAATYFFLRSIDIDPGPVLSSETKWRYIFDGSWSGTRGSARSHVPILDTCGNSSSTHKNKPCGSAERIALLSEPCTVAELQRLWSVTATHSWMTVDRSKKCIRYSATQLVGLMSMHTNC